MLLRQLQKVMQPANCFKVCLYTSSLLALERVICKAPATFPENRVQKAQTVICSYRFYSTIHSFQHHLISMTPGPLAPKASLPLPTTVGIYHLRITSLVPHQQPMLLTAISRQ